MPPRAQPNTCDHCRTRKIKCVEDEQDPSGAPCAGCSNLQIPCTRLYVRKKPGRKNTFVIALREQQAAAERSSGSSSSGGTKSSPGPARLEHRSPYAQHAPYSADRTGMQRGGSGSQRGGPSLAMNSSGRFDVRYGTVHPPARSPITSFAVSPGLRESHNNGGLSWLDSVGLLGQGFDTLGGFDSLAPGGAQFPSEQAHLLSLESPENLFPAGAANGGKHDTPRPEPQLEDVTSWAHVAHFISLYLQYLWPLLPLVHRPTFAENLATRLDVRDTEFRALLLSLVAFSISQLPTSRLVTDQLDVEALKRLQRRCHRTSQDLQRIYHSRVTLTQICIVIFDNFYLLSIGLTHTAAAKLGQAVQLAFSLGLHSDSRTAALGLDPVEVQLRRRVFWQLYASDKTRAIPGNPMLVNDFQGVCSYPEAVDDDFITSQGMFSQPPSRTSLLVGFVAVSKLFRILSECFFHHRCVLSNLETISLGWTVAAEERIHALLVDLPPAIQDPTTVEISANRQVFATQRANILITAAIVKFALYDLRSALNVDEEQLSKERETIAREIHNLLMSIPVEDLASNGESVRCKVFHIACALCGQSGTQASTPGTDTDLVRDWCDMFSTISFVQMPPPPPDSALDSTAVSPREPGSGSTV